MLRAACVPVILTGILHHRDERLALISVYGIFGEIGVDRHRIDRRIKSLAIFIISVSDHKSLAAFDDGLIFVALVRCVTIGKQLLQHDRPSFLRGDFAFV